MYKVNRIEKISTSMKKYRYNQFKEPNKKNMNFDKPFIDYLKEASNNR